MYTVALNREKSFKLAKKAGYLTHIKVIRQGELIAYSLRKYWNQFSLSGVCKQA